VSVFLELVWLNNLATFILSLRVIFLKLLDDVLADISISLLYLLSDVHGILCGDLLTTISEVLKYKLSDVLSCKRNVSHAAANDESIGNREDMSHTITWVNNCPSQILLANLALLYSSTWNLGIEGEGGLDTNEKTFNIECLKHDFSHLLSVFWGVQGRLSQDESVLLRFAPQLRINSSVPELLHGFPVFNLAASNNVLQVVRLLMQESFITNVVVEFGVLELLALAGTLCCPLLQWIGDHCRNQIAGLHVAGIAHLCVSCAIVDHDCRKIAHF